MRKEYDAMCTDIPDGDEVYRDGIKQHTCLWKSPEMYYVPTSPFSSVWCE